MRELHSGGEPHTELKPIKNKQTNKQTKRRRTRRDGKVCVCMLVLVCAHALCVCVCVRARLCTRGRGLPFLRVTSRSFLKVKTTVGCGNGSFRGFSEIRLMSACFKPGLVTLTAEPRPLTGGLA